MSACTCTCRVRNTDTHARTHARTHTQAGAYLAHACEDGFNGLLGSRGGVRWNRALAVIGILQETKEEASESSKNLSDGMQDAHNIEQ